MKNKNGQIKIIINAIIAFILVISIFSIIVYFTDNTPPWIYTPNGATSKHGKPNSIIINSSEGFSINYTDENGYNNEKTVKPENVIGLTVGSSQTEARNVMYYENYTFLLNKNMSENSNFHFYNIGESGFFFEDIFLRYNAIKEKYKNANIIIIETHYLDFNLDKLNSNMNSSIEYNEDIVISKLKYFLQSIPIIRTAGHQIKSFNSGLNSPFIFNNSLQRLTEEKHPYTKYKKTMTKVIEKISILSGNSDCIILYHPILKFIGNKPYVSNNNIKMIAILNDICKEYKNVNIISTGDEYIKAFNKSYMLPYGFSNTKINSGHLNSFGHKIIADKLANYINTKYGENK